MSRAQKHLYLISNRTSRKVEEGASNTGTEAYIFLLGSSIGWSESIKRAEKTQFVDLRELDANDMKAFAGSPSNMDAWRRQYALEATPTKFESFAAPTSMQFYRFLAHLQVVELLPAWLILLLTGLQLGAVLLLLLGIGTFFSGGTQPPAQGSFADCVGCACRSSLVSFYIQPAVSFCNTQLVDVGGGLV